MRLAVFERALRDCKGELADFDPALITTSDAARAFEVFDALERILVAAKTLVASRATEAGAWKENGHKSPASWVAETTGSGYGGAISMLETSERLAGLPETTEALRRGELSAPQVKEIAATAAQNPAAETELLEAAQRNGLKGLKEECRRVQARGITETEARARYEQIRKNRSLQLWTDPDGVGRLEARLTPDDLARVAGAIKIESNAIFNEARKAGHREPTVAYDADALVALITGAATSTATSGRRSDSSGRSPSGATTVMHLRVDLAALRRGELQEGESCEIPGVGPVPLATAVNMMGESILKVMVTDGVDVRSVCHVGRTVPAHIRSALELRDEKCVVPGCEVTKGLEIDHYHIGFAQDGPTELWNLCRLCRWHHHLKTHCGYAIEGEPGSWEWKGPGSEDNPILTS
jgi:hypothetical protein